LRLWAFRLAIDQVYTATRTKVASQAWILVLACAHLKHGFEESPIHERHLLLLIKDLRRHLG